jgi:D-sedoheptulose 7-phosphate isomerase
MGMINKIEEQISDSLKVKQEMLNSPGVLEGIERAVNELTKAFKNGKKLLIAGNGGSAADAQHLAAEFINKFSFDREALPAIALTTDTSVITSIGNDSSFNNIFSRQVSALGEEGDIFFAISTSGNSSNLLTAIEIAKRRNLLTIGLTGESGGRMASLCDICIKIPASQTPRIQEAHLLIEHIICSIVEQNIFTNNE